MMDKYWESNGGYIMSHYQDMAAERDYRTTCVDEIWWNNIIDSEALIHNDFMWAIEDAGLANYEDKFWVKVRFEVCPACGGRGKYVNPSIDAHGLTREDFDEDFGESYWRGDYDISCKLCLGRNVIPVPTDPAISKIIEEVMNERAEYRAERLAELRAGC